MLAVKNYPPEYIKRCRSKIETEINIYRKILTSVDENAVFVEFESRYFNNLVLVLDWLFVHRTRGIEGKDGNPLNEVRVLCDSIINNNNELAMDKTIRLDPDKSILKYHEGDCINLTLKDFERLSEAFLDEIQKKYST